MSTRYRSQVKKRDVAFAQKVETRIWQETADDQNPFLAQGWRCAGYDVFELVEKRSFVDYLYLLFCGELPDKAQAELLEALMQVLINPGPRHPATQAAMSASVSKAMPEHLLPIGLSVMGGHASTGAGTVAACTAFIHDELPCEAQQLAAEAMASQSVQVPGFGLLYGSVDPFAEKAAHYLSQFPAAGNAMAWGNDFVQAAEGRWGWLTSGLAACVLADLGIPPAAALGLFQLLSAPGILAHAVEMQGKPMTSMPFVDDSHYEIQTDHTQPD